MLRNVKNYCGLISATLSIDKFRMLLRKSLLVLITIFLFFSHANALVFERRPRPDPDLSYFLYPMAGSIPGLQDFYGLGATVSGIGGSEVDITAVSLRGEAKYFEDGDFGIEFLTVLDIPVFTSRLSFSFFIRISETELGLRANGGSIPILTKPIIFSEVKSMVMR